MLLKLRQPKVAIVVLLLFSFLIALFSWLNARPVGSQVPNIGPGDLTPYLMGHWDTRLRRTTVFYVMNPTSRNLNAIFAFFNNEEKPLKALIARLSANDIVEVDARRYLPAGRWGVVKIFSVHGATDPKQLILEPGIKGFQKELFLTVSRPAFTPYKYRRLYNMNGVVSPWPWTLQTHLPRVHIMSATEANLKEIPADVVDDAERKVIQGLLTTTNVVFID